MKISKSKLVEWAVRLGARQDWAEAVSMPQLAEFIDKRVGG